MNLPVSIPYFDYFLYFLAFGGFCFLFVAAGAIFRLWSWRSARRVAEVFLIVAVIFLVIAWYSGRSAGAG